MLKKKIYKLAIFILFAIIPTFLLLSACGKKAPKYYYFTVDALPLHVSEVTVQNTTGGYGSDSKGKFLTDGDSAEIRFFIEEGYNLGTLKVLSNGEELTITEEEGEYAYKATFTPTKDFTITFAGAVAPKVANISLAVGDMSYPSYHDRIMVEIDRYDLFGLEKGKMSFEEFKNIGSSFAQINYDTPITVSIYTVGAYDFAIQKQNSVRIHNADGNTGIGYKEQVEKIIDEENQKYGYKHTIRFSQNNTITIHDEVKEEYMVDFVHDWDKVSMNKDLFTLSVNGETRAEASGDEYIQGVIKFSDFTGTNLPKLKIDFLKYADENYKNFYDKLTFDLAGTQAQRSADGSYVEIEFDKYYNYNFEHECYIVSTNALELLKTMDRVTEKNYRIVEKIEMNGVENSSQHGFIDTAKLIQDKCVGRANGGNVYFLKNEYLTFTIDFYSEVDYEFVRIGGVVVKVDSTSNSDVVTSNSDVVVTKEQYEFDGETKASRFTIKVRASVSTEKIEFFTNNP